MKRAADKGGESEGGDRPPRRADAPSHITWCAAGRAGRVDALAARLRAARSARWSAGAGPRRVLTARRRRRLSLSLSTLSRRDEGNLEENERIKAALNPRKIDEPNTPYLSPMDTDEERELGAHSVAARLTLDCGASLSDSVTDWVARIKAPR